MIRKLISGLFPAIIVMLLASCNGDDFTVEADTPQSDGPQVIRFEMLHAGAVATHGTAATRVSTSTDGIFTNSWTNGDKVGVYIIKGDGGLQSSGNWVDNMEMSYNNGSWTYTLPTSREYYPVGEKLNFYAYYPYQDSIDPLNMTFPVQADQSVEADFEKSYLMAAVKTNVFNSSNPVQLEFSHALAMVELSVASGGDGAKMTESVTVTLEGCKPVASLNLGTGAATASGSASAITMYRVEQPGDADYLTKYTYRALVPAQTAAAGATLFKFTQGARSLSHKPAAQATLTTGQVKPYKITLQATLAPDHAYAVGDIYPHKGLPMGVVFETSNGGKNGKIIHLLDSPLLEWGPSGVNTGATSEDDGQYNMDIIRSLDPDFSDYPGFKWCADMGDGWYYPAFKEVQAFLIVAIRERLNPVLISIGGTVLADSNVVGVFYGSSTELYSNAEYVVVVQVSESNSAFAFEKWTTRLPVRAVRRF